MGRHRKTRTREDCIRCGLPIPLQTRSDARYCSKRCRSSDEKARYCANNPEYVKRQRRLSDEIHHRNTHGHTRYLDLPQENPLDRYGKARSLGYRSMLEVSIADRLTEQGVQFSYESLKIHYRVEETRAYIPDIVLPNGIIVESKGRFTAVDRKKHLLVKAQNPELDIRFVFSNSRSKLSKASKTTYAAWCEKHGFLYADRFIPEEWLSE